jgi:hypothetical protein
VNAIVGREPVARGARDHEPVAGGARRHEPVAVLSSAGARRATGGSPPARERVPRKA